MDLNSLINRVISFVQGNPALSAVIVLAVIFSIIAVVRPKAAFKLAVAAILLAVAGYIIYLVIDAMNVGRDKKGEMINRTRKLVE